MTAPGRYPLRTRILHWLTAVLIFSTLLIGFVMVNSIGSYASLRAVHMTLGVLILAIVVLRAANRFTHRTPQTACPPSGGSSTNSWWVPNWRCTR